MSGEPNLLFVRVADYAFRETTWCAGMRVCHICRTKFIHLFFEIFSQETTNSRDPICACDGVFLTSQQHQMDLSFQN